MPRHSLSLPRSLKKMKKETKAFIVAHLTSSTKHKLVFEPFDPDFEKIMAEATQKEITAPVEEKNMETEAEKSDDSGDSNMALTFGLRDLGDQLFRQLHRKRPVFNLMVVGKSGLGKSSFVNSFFCADILKAGPMASMPTTTSLEVKSIVLEENQIQLDLTVIDTPGFGGAINYTDCMERITAYIDAQYEMCRKKEFSVDRSQQQPSPGNAHDTRVHCCIYFIEPSGHALSELDILALTRLSTMVNVVAVIARADSLNTDELAQFKQTINRQLYDNRIKLFDFYGDEQAQKSPFAVVSHNSVIEDENGKLKRVRRYLWGNVEVDKIEHSETKLLQTLIISEHFFDLIDHTHEFHYQNYRTLVATTHPKLETLIM